MNADLYYLPQPLAFEYRMAHSSQVSFMGARF